MKTLPSTTSLQGKKEIKRTVKREERKKKALASSPSTDRENVKPSILKKTRQKSGTRASIQKQHQSHQVSTTTHHHHHHESIAHGSKERAKSKPKKDLTLAQRLLADITDKYKAGSNNSCYLSKLEKKTMVSEINTLAGALMKIEGKLAKQKEKHK